MTTGNIDPNADVEIEWTDVPDGATNCLAIDDAIRQPNVPTTTDYITATASAAKLDQYEMNTIAGDNIITQIVIWIYGKVAGSILPAVLGDIYINGAWMGEQNFGLTTSDSWKSIIFNGTWTQANLNDMEVTLEYTTTGGVSLSAKVYAMYGSITYTSTNVKKINIGDSWKNIAGIQINIGDVWKVVAGMKINIGDVWKTIF